MNYKRGRPENILPAELYYNKTQSLKYTNSSRIIKIQKEMSERAIELLNFSNKKTKLILDVGCGSGISGDILSLHGFNWIGVDISQHMLNICKTKKFMNIGDTFLNDMGQGLPFKIGVFDGAISISALQWLCTNYNNKENAYKRMNVFFSSLYSSICTGGKAVFQFYPENTEQTKLLTKAATKSGFTGGVVIDYPNSTKARKYYLVLFSGISNEPPPKPLLGVHEDDKNERTVINYDERKKKNYRRKGLKQRKSMKEYVIKKKARDRFRGRKTASDSKYTARKRKPRW